MSPPRLVSRDFKTFKINLKTVGSVFLADFTTKIHLAAEDFEIGEMFSVSDLRRYADLSILESVEIQYYAQHNSNNSNGKFYPRVQYSDFLHLLVKQVAACNSGDGSRHLNIFGYKLSYIDVKAYCVNMGKGFMASFKIAPSHFDAYSKMQVKPRDHISDPAFLSYIIKDENASVNVRMLSSIMLVMRKGINAFTMPKMRLMKRLEDAAAAAHLIGLLRLVRADHGLGKEKDFFSSNVQNGVIQNFHSMYAVLASDAFQNHQLDHYFNMDGSQPCENDFRYVFPVFVFACLNWVVAVPNLFLVDHPSPIFVDHDNFSGYIGPWLDLALH